MKKLLYLSFIILFISCNSQINTSSVTYEGDQINSLKNIDLVKLICRILDKVHPSSKLSSYIELIKQVDDRPGHDKRYSLNVKKLKKTQTIIKKKLPLYVFF